MPAPSHAVQPGQWPMQQWPVLQVQPEQQAQQAQQQPMAGWEQQAHQAWQQLAHQPLRPQQAQQQGWKQQLAQPAALVQPPQQSMQPSAQPQLPQQALPQQWLLPAPALSPPAALLAAPSSPALLRGALLHCTVGSEQLKTLQASAWRMACGSEAKRQTLSTGVRPAATATADLIGSKHCMVCQQHGPGLFVHFKYFSHLPPCRCSCGRLGSCPALHSSC